MFWKISNLSSAEMNLFSWVKKKCRIKFRIFSLSELMYIVNKRKIEKSVDRLSNQQSTLKLKAELNSHQFGYCCIICCWNCWCCCCSWCCCSCCFCYHCHCCGCCCRYCCCCWCCCCCCCFWVAASSVAGAVVSCCCCLCCSNCSGNYCHIYCI